MSEKLYCKAMLETSTKDASGDSIYTFRITSDVIDRQGEIVTTDGWKVENYLENPVVLDSHQYNGIEHIVGRCMSLSRNASGWDADIKFNKTERGRLAETLVSGGDLRAVSVGFRSLKVDYPEIGLRQRSIIDMTVAPDRAVKHVEKELLEISVVPIPANAQALRLRGVESIQIEEPEVITKIVTPDWMRINARRGLEWYDEGLAGDGIVQRTVREARQMVAGTVTQEKATRMAAWFARHMVDLDAPAAQMGHPEYPSPGVVAHALWGGGSKTSSERAMAWARAHSGEETKMEILPEMAPVDKFEGTPIEALEAAKGGVTIIVADEAEVSGGESEDDGEGQMCPQCGHMCDAEDNYCPECGAALGSSTVAPPATVTEAVVTCPKCGAQVRGKYCPKCGWKKGHEDHEIKGAIPHKKTPLAPEDQAWDGAAVQREADTDTLRIISAWYDEAAPDVKASYKLAHHEASAPYRTVWRGVAAAMGAMMGARGGVDMPDEDRQAVYNHLAAHYQEFNKQAPQMRDADDVEVRTVPRAVETPTAPMEQSWDAAAEVGAANPSTLRQMCAWYDETEPDKKTSYKLPHHEAGAPHRVVWRGVVAAMRILYGAHGGVNVPDSERKAIYDHLAVHYRQFGRIPPEMKEMTDSELAEMGVYSTQPDVIVRGIDEDEGGMSGQLRSVVWPLAASAMYAVLNDTTTPDEVRKRAYVGIQRLYGLVDEVAPDFVPRKTVAKLTEEQRDGMFWSGEEAIATKAGRALSTVNETRLRQAIELVGLVLQSNAAPTPPDQMPPESQDAESSKSEEVNNVEVESVDLAALMDFLNRG